MSRAAAALVSAFIDLLPAEREEVISELLRRGALDGQAGPADDEITAAADQVFQAYDREETSTR